MSEKSGKGGKGGMKSAGVWRAKTSGPERKKSSHRLFSLDSLMGKALCVLLVVILTVGAFLAPKLINNLYDAGTLMQIAYMDMNLSPYAVPYTVFPEKIEALARAQTAGERLIALPAEETAERISDEELIEIANRELAMARNSVNAVFSEGWWDAQTMDNLVSREKYTVYMRPPAGAEDNGQEMTPFQVWLLSFAVTEKQDELVVYDGKERKILPQFATDRLIVCMDADFYKIYAIAVAGDSEKAVAMYGCDMSFYFGVPADAPERLRKWSDSYNAGYARETRTFIVDHIWTEWVSYWDITLKDYLYLIDDAGTCGAHLLFADETAGTKEAASGAEDNVSFAAGYTDPTGNKVVEVVSDADRESITNAAAAAGSPYDDVPQSEGSLPLRQLEAGETFLNVGGSVDWDETDDNVWILKAGCMEFFEMMQF